MALDPWLEIDVTGWSVVAPENRGTRSKDWVASEDGIRWLRKTPRRPKDPRAPVRDAELAFEAIALRMARAAGLEAPESAVATWREADGTTARGIVIRYFLSDTEELAMGSELLSRYFPNEYDPKRHELHTLARVRHVLESLHAGESLLVRFARILAFDAWVGNGDRHQENWGIIRAPGVPIRLAPLYDPAACLGSELAQSDRRFRTPDEVSPTYVERCPSGFGDGLHLVQQPAVLAELRKWPEWQEHSGTWIASFERVAVEVQELLGKVPAEWLSLERNRHARALLTARLDWLRRTA